MTVLTLVGCGQMIKLQIKQNCFGLWLYFNETSAQRFLLKFQLNWLIFYEATATISIYAYIFEEGNDIFCGFIHLQYEKKMIHNALSHTTSNTAQNPFHFYFKTKPGFLFEVKICLL